MKKVTGLPRRRSPGNGNGKAAAAGSGARAEGHAESGKRGKKAGARKREAVNGRESPRGLGGALPEIPYDPPAFLSEGLLPPPHPRPLAEIRAAIDAALDTAESCYQSAPEEFPESGHVFLATAAEVIIAELGAYARQGSRLAAASLMNAAGLGANILHEAYLEKWPAVVKCAKTRAAVPGFITQDKGATSEFLEQLKAIGQGSENLRPQGRGWQRNVAKNQLVMEMFMHMNREQFKVKFFANPDRPPQKRFPLADERLAEIVELPDWDGSETAAKKWAACSWKILQDFSPTGDVVKHAIFEGGRFKEMKSSRQGSLKRQHDEAWRGFARAFVKRKGGDSPAELSP